MAPSSTCTVELQLQTPAATKQTGSFHDRVTRADLFSGDGQRLVDECATPDDTPPSGAVSALQRWNNPRGNMFRIGACFWCFLVMGANDAAYGVSASHYISYRNMLTVNSRFFNRYDTPAMQGSDRC